MRDTLARAAFALALITPLALAYEGTGQCLFPKTKTLPNGDIEFASQVPVFATPSKDTIIGYLKTLKSFTSGISSSGFIQISPNNDPAQTIGWVRESDFYPVEPRNCH